MIFLAFSVTFMFSSLRCTFTKPSVSTVHPISTLVGELGDFCLLLGMFTSFTRLSIISNALSGYPRHRQCRAQSSLRHSPSPTSIYTHSTLLLIYHSRTHFPGQPKRQNVIFAMGRRCIQLLQPGCRTKRPCVCAGDLHSPIDDEGRRFALILSTQPPSYNGHKPRRDNQSILSSVSSISATSS